VWSVDWREMKQRKKQSRLTVRVLFFDCLLPSSSFWLELLEVRLLVTGQIGY
jgi:hypothetical protein